MYDGDNNRVFQIDNTYKWEDCYGKEVLIPQSQRTEDGDSPKEQLAFVVKGGANAKGYTLTEYVNDVNRENAEALMEYGADEKVRQAYGYGEERVSVELFLDNSSVCVPRYGFSDVFTLSLKEEFGKSKSDLYVLQKRSGVLQYIGTIPRE